MKCFEFLYIQDSNDLNINSNQAKQKRTKKKQKTLMLHICNTGLIRVKDLLLWYVFKLIYTLQKYRLFNDFSLRGHSG